MNWYVPIILIGVLLVITLLLILADKLLGSGGERKIVLNQKREIPVDSDETVLTLLSNQKIFIPSACGGKATCGLCKVRVVEGGGPIRGTEKPFMSEDELSRGVRLSCQLKVREDMAIEIPESMLGAVEFKTRVVKVEDLTYDTKMVRLKLIEPKTMDFKPGQYAQIKVPGIESIRAYSIASNPRFNDHIEFIIRLVPKGQATTFVHKAMREGDPLTITGPYGDFFLQEDSDRDMICIAGGSGKAPIRAILQYMKDRGMTRKVIYFFGARTTRDLYYTEEMQALEAEFENFTYVPALSHAEPDEKWEGAQGLITEVVDRMTGDLREAEAYLCGSPGMIDACIKVLEKHDIQSEHVFYDKFTA
ncbi:MAG: oxidoreductase [Acholeplasmatales bacterium]|nr:MAG: oxidoreductase [Acholeplasmatales bacterium]